MYWEPALYLALSAEAIAAAYAVGRGMREGYDRPFETGPVYRVGLVLTAVSFLLALRFDVMVTVPSLMLLASSLAVLAGARLRLRMSPVEALASTIAFYSFALASLAARAAVLDLDPRGEALLPWVLLTLAAGWGLLAALVTMSEPQRSIAAVMGLLGGVGLAALGFWLLFNTRIGSPLYGDALSMALLALLVTGAAIASRLSPYLVLASGVIAALLAGRSLLAGGVPYIACTGSCGSLATAWLIFVIVVAAPRLYLEAETVRGRMRAAGLETVFSPSTLASASVLLAGLAAWASLQGSLSIGTVAAVSVLVASAAAGGGSASALVLFLGAIAAIYSPALGIVVSAIAAVAVPALLRNQRLGPLNPPKGLVYGLLLVVIGLAAGGYIAATLGHSMQAEASITVAGLGPAKLVQPPSDEVTHAFFQLYLGVKNETLLYALLAPKLGKDEALKMVEFAHAVRLAAEKRGINDPYNITELDIPRKMPSLETRIETNGVSATVNVPASSILYGHPYTSGVERAGLDLVSVTLPSNVTKALTDIYLRLVSDPKLAGDDALRYTIFAAMAVSWRETGTLNMTAQLIFDSLLGNNTVANHVSSEVSVARASLGVIALVVYMGCLVAAPVAPLLVNVRRSG
ncbi:hypothetical protein Pyrde_0785 [Pyrodictium delaneyi]|uniref:Uncharacterized protein n=1 Tax=Pyrodictium delaneyi TaxID=1273541 RepID=A0A0P0N2A8_9CREN|nr:hypothetical protein [Pyrodictium delaneyi]ALL00835.1 hypothetical protein Pyrde_0785 [Pyrodictium delaneyi]OWJ55534.1 hypothetical protein Pdsh_01725 [Pyrodictium delaneyi]